MDFVWADLGRQLPMVLIINRRGVRLWMVIRCGQLANKGGKGVEYERGTTRSGDQEQGCVGLRGGKGSSLTQPLILL